MFVRNKQASTFREVKYSERILKKGTNKNCFLENFAVHVWKFKIKSQRKSFGNSVAAVPQGQSLNLTSSNQELIRVNKVCIAFQTCNKTFVRKPVSALLSEYVGPEVEQGSLTPILDEMSRELWVFPKDYAKCKSSFTWNFATIFLTRVEDLELVARL